MWYILHRFDEDILINPLLIEINLMYYWYFLNSRFKWKSRTQSVIPVTDSSGNAVTDVNGNPVTQSVVGVTDSNGNPVTGSLLLQCIRLSDLWRKKIWYFIAQVTEF